MSNRGDNITEANLQADSLSESQPKGQQEDGKGGKWTVPPMTCRCGPPSKGHLQAILICTIVY